METTLNRDLTGGDVPPFSYTGIAHTFKNSPFNDYPYAMARLRWFTDSFDPDLEYGHPELSRLRSALIAREVDNGHFSFLDLSGADAVDSLLDAVFRQVEGGRTRNAHDLGPCEPGIGRWANEDEYTVRHSLLLPFGTDRRELYERVSDRLVSQGTDDAAIDEVYLYPPKYGDGPDRLVTHEFRIFAHSEASVSVSSAAAGARLREALGSVLGRVRIEVSSPS
ncbi:MAG TPA: hypothetical protein VMF31_06815 [Solirubrobacterales bacterium]|nr:hypothetical protein [Solirubrobacterales bacterium]